MTYTTHSVTLTDGQKQNLAKAFEHKCELTIRLKNNQLRGDFPLMLTSTQIKNINKAINNGTGIDIRITKTQMSAQSKNGGFLGALAGLLPTVAKFAPKILGPLATGALGGVGESVMKKLMGQGMISIPHDKRKILLGSGYLTKSQERTLNKDGYVKVTEKQQRGGFLPFLAAALGVPAVLGMLSGKGLHVDPPGVTQYRRIPRPQKKNL